MNATTPTPVKPTSVDDLAPILTRFRVWSAERVELYTTRKQGSRYLEFASDEQGIELLRELADLVPGMLPDPVQPCMWCSAYLRWHPGIGRWQGTLGDSPHADQPTGAARTWTDRCPIATDHRHQPAPSPIPIPA